MNPTTQPLTFPVPLSFEAHEIAQTYSQGAANPHKRKQIYLNSLAVYAVDFYLRCLGFETDWQGSDSRDPVMLKLMDVADLTVKKIGKLECRPVLPEADTCEIPPEVREDRIGYVAVQFNQSLRQATILGYSPTAAAAIPLNQWRSLEEFLPYLNQIKKNATVNLRQWLEGVVETGWLTLNELLNPPQLELAFRSGDRFSLTQGKKIDLGLDLEGKSVALAVTVTPKAGNEVDILVQVYPLEQNYLPLGVKLLVKDSLGEEILSATAREADNFIQLEFSAELGETFSVTVALDGVEVTQEFAI
jgi:hypothetical protein